MGNLLHYALIFLVVALIAAAVGFGGVAGFAMEAARYLKGKQPHSMVEVKDLKSGDVTAVALRPG